MGGLTPDDVRHWDLGVISQLFESAAKLQGAHHQLGEMLTDAQQRIHGWHGESGDAARAELDKARVDIDASGIEHGGVGKAVQAAEMDISGAKVALDEVDSTAASFGWKITDNWTIDTTSGTSVGLDQETYETELQQAQSELVEAKSYAEQGDQKLAAAVRAAVGDAPAAPGGGGENHEHDAGAEQRPGVTDVNDPGVTWQPGFDPKKWDQSWHNPLLADNPPGYTGGPGAARDQAWQTYLAHFPTDKRGYLPNPDAVNDPGLKVLANGATQLGTSYAWGGKGPGKGTLNLDPPGGGAHTYHDDQRVGLDCSGLAEFAAGKAQPGTDIGAGTGGQLGSSHLTDVPPGAPLKPGDFIYYGTGGAHHVGIYVAPGVILNAPQSGLPVQVQERSTVPGPDKVDDLIRARRLP